MRLTVAGCTPTSTSPTPTEGLPTCWIPTTEFLATLAAWRVPSGQTRASRPSGAGPGGPRAGGPSSCSTPAGRRLPPSRAQRTLKVPAPTAATTGLPGGSPEVSIMSAAIYPARVEADLDPRLSRWLWLVKWVLAIPHYVVLAFLWSAFVVLSAVAFVAILATGQYPRRIFDFNVGVLRWTWRVQYYAYGALATDAYPPFTLKEVPEYPAHFDVAYPNRLSRGLVLVKSWLLALPHYIVAGLLV